jgi:hypothetical protein
MKEGYNAGVLEDQASATFIVRKWNSDSRGHRRKESSGKWNEIPQNGQDTKKKNKKEKEPSETN